MVNRSQSALDGFAPAIHVSKLHSDRPQRAETANGYLVIILREVDGILSRQSSLAPNSQ